MGNYIVWPLLVPYFTLSSVILLSFVVILLPHVLKAILNHIN